MKLNILFRSRAWQSYSIYTYRSAEEVRRSRGEKRLEIWGRIQREAARRRTSDWRGGAFYGVEILLAATSCYERSCISLHCTRSVDLGCVYSFFVIVQSLPVFQLGPKAWKGS